MDRLRENLEALKMKNTLEILDNYLERAVADKLNIVEVLDHIFLEEAKSKRRRAYERQIQMSGFPIKKTLDDFDFSFQPSIDKRQIDELATMRFLENGENVVFLGPPGVGKTHLASALGLVAAQHRFSTYYINCHHSKCPGGVGLRNYSGSSTFPGKRRDPGRSGYGAICAGPVQSETENCRHSDDHVSIPASALSECA